MTEWIYKWKKNDWRTTIGEPVKNQSDMKRLHDLCEQITVKWVSPGYFDNYHNNYVFRHMSQDIKEYMAMKWLIA